MNLLTVLIATILVLACTPDRAAEEQPAQPAPAAAPAAADVTFTASDLQTLRWLEGRWQGSGPDYPAFFEEYAFVNDSTIETTHYADSTFTDATQVTTVALRSGRLEHRYEDMLWHATELSPTSVRFAPAQGAEHSFTWRQVSDDEWTATMHMADGSEPVYRLQRVRR